MYPQSLGQPQNYPPQPPRHASSTLKTPQETLSVLTAQQTLLEGSTVLLLLRLSEVFFRIRAPSAHEVAPKEP